MRTLTYQGLSINYTINRSPKRKKTVSIAMDPHGTIVVTAPGNYPETRITELLYKQWSWIVGKQEKMADLAAKVGTNRWVAGRRVLYLGNWYTLAVENTIAPAAEVQVSHRHLTLYAKEQPVTEETVRTMLTAWYQRQAKEILSSKTYELARTMEVALNQVKVKEQRSRWGSCSRLGNINLNWRLVMAPEEVIGYVITHELSHLKEMNHSSRFWKHVGKYDPNYRKHQEWLKAYGPLLYY